MQIIRKASLTATPWKNGGGVTHELIRVPAAGKFRWRLSVAQIDVSGPFSDFAGYDRKMVLLRGAGVRLTFDTADAVTLTQVGDMAGFDGALKTDCQLVEGSCTDLNLMVAQSMGNSTARVEQLQGRLPLPASMDRITLVVGITGGLSVDAGGLPVHLEPWDLAILPVGAGGAVATDPPEASSSLVFLATLDDNSA